MQVIMAIEDAMTIQVLVFIEVSLQRDVRRLDVY
jgi:hypothetical protein